ncbi:hypothetical protein [Devosia naphthalenivorans]|uniref:hypothetical protein n=1 Tax=Devosia naphthalenivorans TaxID=2082392 RepID=UPI000D3BA44D|nr:hypothetical protein [Devosia naphthalenivorans]
MALTFDAEYYYDERPDVFAAYEEDNIGLSYEDFALWHFNAYGDEEGTQPNAAFNAAEYLALNPDVADAIEEGDFLNAWQHYQLHGGAEGRALSDTIPARADFPFQAYIDANADLQAAGIDTLEEAYEHYITFGYAENRPGTPGSESDALTEALADLAGAREAVAEFVEENGDVEAAFGAAEDELAGDILDNGTDRQLDAAVVTAEANLSAAQGAYEVAVEDDAELAAQVAEFERLTAELVAAKEVRDAAQVDADAAVEAFIAAELENDVVVVRTATAITADGEVVAEFQQFDAAGPEGRIVITADGVGYAGLQEVVNELNAWLEASDAVNEIQEDRTPLIEDITQNGGAAGAAYQDLIDAQNALETAEAAVVARAELRQDVADAQLLVDQLDALVANEEGALEALEALGFEAPVVVDGAELATDEGDLFIYDGENSGTITGFDSEDALYIGADFAAPITLADDDVLADDATDFGSVSELDIFIQQGVGETVIYIETETFQGNQDGPFTGETITLVGVDADTVTFENGVLRVSEATA